MFFGSERPMEVYCCALHRHNFVGLGGGVGGVNKEVLGPFSLQRSLPTIDAQQAAELLRFLFTDGLLNLIKSSA